MLTNKDLHTIADIFGYNIEAVVGITYNKVMSNGRERVLDYFSSGNDLLLNKGFMFTHYSPLEFKQAVSIAMLIRYYDDYNLPRVLDDMLLESQLRIKTGIGRHSYISDVSGGQSLIICNNGKIKFTDYCLRNKPLIASMVARLTDEKPLSLKQQLQKAGYSIKHTTSFTYEVHMPNSDYLATTCEVEQGRLVDFTVHNNRNEIRQVLEKHNNTKQRFVITDDNTYAFELEHYMSNDSYNSIDQGTLANNDKLSFISIAASYIIAVERRKGSLVTTIEYNGNAYSIVPHSTHGQVKTFLEELLCGC